MAKLNYTGGKPKEIAVARPSASVLLISSTNQILLLHRVRTSSAFPSAHVFPGGNLSTFHDGDAPPASDAARHEDGEAYRLAAIRETFEESGILLARNNGFGRLIEVEEGEREAGRREVHEGKMEFRKWLAGKGGRADVEGLVPFTRWVTPPNLAKRFTTQMYLYFLPLAGEGGGVEKSSNKGVGPLDGGSGDTLIPVPTHDGGLEHTEARFLQADDWIRMAQTGEIILFPPQLFLLSLISPFLKAPTSSGGFGREELSEQRQKLKEFVKTGEPSWGEKCISPIQVMRRKEDGRVVLGLDKPGEELKGSERKGEFERVVLVDFTKEGPRRVEVRWRKDVLEEERAAKEKL